VLIITHDLIDWYIWFKLLRLCNRDGYF